jgi:hypothetical protein
LALRESDHFRAALRLCSIDGDEFDFPLRARSTGLLIVAGSVPNQCGALRSWCRIFCGDSRRAVVEIS